MGRGRITILLVMGLVLASGVAVTAFAATGADRARPASKTTPKIAGVAGGGCKMGYDTETSIVTPPDDSTIDNTPAATVQLAKSCTGAVVGQFTSEVSTSNAGSFIHLDMRATCVDTGGFTPHCAVGKQIFGSPGHSFFQNNALPSIETHAMNMVWSGLGKGVWKFEVLPGGNGTAFLDFRTFHVEAFTGG
jgi:hypothetical protein